MTGQRPINGIIAAAVGTGLAVGIFSWAGGLGGYSEFFGADLREAVQYRRIWRFYPTNLYPLEDYERAIGRKAHPEDFKDINDILGEERFETPTDIVGIAPVPAPKKLWWKEVLEKARAAEGKPEKIVDNVRSI